jgi:DNA-binding transcriptional LysR family regulator
MVPTPRAVQVRDEVHAVLARAQAVFAPPGEPDLSTLERTFTLLASDVATAIGAELLGRTTRDAPGIRLRFLSEVPDTETGQLRTGEVDLDIGVVADPPPEIRVEPLATDRMVAVVRAGHPLARGRLRLDRFAAAAHVSASRRGKLSGPLDEALAGHGLRRRVVVAAPTYAAALLMVSRTDLVGLVADRFGRAAVDALGLVRLELPLDLPPLPLSLAWHARNDADGAHRWLRQCVRDTVAEVPAG